MNWRAEAACRGTSTALFYPSLGDLTAARHAKAVCATCPVRVECLEEALRDGELFGIRGGLTPRERRRARRQLFSNRSLGYSA
jgi:WhiB family transcriptional regulator, redox-sensing transcriptional regulator